MAKRQETGKARAYLINLAMTTYALVIYVILGYDCCEIANI